MIQDLYSTSGIRFRLLRHDKQDQMSFFGRRQLYQGAMVDCVKIASSSNTRNHFQGLGLI